MGEASDLAPSPSAFPEGTISPCDAPTVRTVQFGDEWPLVNVEPLLRGDSTHRPRIHFRQVQPVSEQLASEARMKRPNQCSAPDLTGPPCQSADSSTSSPTYQANSSNGMVAQVLAARISLGLERPANNRYVIPNGSDMFHVKQAPNFKVACAESEELATLQRW